jgi:hypothetical protein
MKFAAHPLKPGELSDTEKIALRAIAAGELIALPLCRRLQKLGLIQQKQIGWELSEQGNIKLMFQRAR